MNLPMSWDEWADHDGVALAARVAKGELTAAELAAQAAAGIAKVDPALSAVVEIFEDAVTDPGTDGTNLDGPFAGLPFLMKDLGPTLKGRLQEMGSLLHARQPRHGRHVHDDEDARGRAQSDRPHHHAGIRGLQLGGQSRRLCHAQSLEYRLHHLRLVGRQRRDGRRRHGADRACHRWRRLDPDSLPGVNGNIGLKVSRGVFSLSPHLSDLSGLVSIQGCQSRTVRDTAAFVDACRGPAPGEFMPFWSPPEPYTRMIARDPARLKIALSYQWGEYRATPHIAAELQKVGRFLEGLGHHVDYALPELDYREAFAAQTTCYISNFAVVISNMLAARGLEKPPEDLIEPINIRIWEHGRNTSYADRARMQAVFNTTSRGFGAFFEDWDIILTPITALPTPKVGTTEYLTISDNPDVLDWFGNLWRNFAFTPLANLCGIPAISLPLATHEHGLPLGIQAIAKQANDGLLLQLAAQIERAIDGKWNAGERPGVHVTSG